MPHHGFDLAEVPARPYSAALFQAFAGRAFAILTPAAERAVLCGGTGQYVQAAIGDFAFPQRSDQVENPVRDRRRIACSGVEEHGSQALWRRWRRAIPQAPPSSTPATCGKARRAPSGFAPLE
ncbi:MAG: hypothetical protein ACLTDR_06860 [Adlercreutzia equolifaciens]